MTKQRTKKNIDSELSRLAQRYHLAEVYVFGSRSQEIADVIRRNGPCRKSSSDVDIGIRPLPGFLLSPLKIVNVAIELEDLFSVERVDIVVLPQAEPFLALDIIRGELLYARDSLDQARYELFVLRRAGDLLPFKKERIEMILGGHKQ